MLTLHTLGILAIGGLAASITLTVDTSADPPYPRDTSYWWLGCKYNMQHINYHILYLYLLHIICLMTEIHAFQNSFFLLLIVKNIYMDRAELFPANIN